MIKSKFRSSIRNLLFIIRLLLVYLYGYNLQITILKCVHSQHTISYSYIFILHWLNLQKDARRTCQLPSISRHSRARFFCFCLLCIKLGNSALYLAIGILLGIKLGNRHLYQVTCVQTVLVPGTRHDKHR